MSVLRSKIVWLVVGLLIGGYFLAQWVSAIGGPEGVHARFGALAPVVTGAIQVALSLTPFPTDILCIAHGTLYGLWPAATLNWFAWWVAGMMEYGISRRAARDFNIDVELSRLPAWLRRFPTGHPAFLILGRMIPWAGGHITSILPGATGVPFGRVVWCSAISIVPGAIATAAVGAGLLKL